ncbi:E3 ubiquitin-protein ligase TRIM71-like [Asterias amurensis]|uniref:E3 ubiquitin-protein ligase TRIM71-like n=1 Tax=Asterias amurensis TaxID=7602 RepID=UPI003AB5F491
MATSSNVMEKLPEGQMSQLKCQACDEGTQASAECIDCKHFLCQECQRAHQRMGILKSHQMHTLGSDYEIPVKSKVVPRCKTHPDQDISLYCKTCRQSICKKCSFGDHREHSLVKPNMACEQRKQEVTDLVAKDEKKSEAISSLSEMEQSSKTFNEMFTDTKKKIYKSAKAVAASVKEEEGKLAEEAEQLHQEAKWKLKKSIMTFRVMEEEKTLRCANGVAAFSNNDIILADIKNKVLVEISESKPQPEQLDIRGLKNPQRIAVNKDDQLIVIDHQEVKIFNRQYELLCRFKPERGKVSNRTLTCLAVDENNLIAVGYSNKKKGLEQISLYEPNGDFKRILPAPGIGNFLMIQTQLCIYWNGDKLHTMDYNGKTVCSTNIGRSGKPPFCPTGMCFIRGIGFYIATRNSSPSEPGEIHQVYPADQQTECVIQDCRHPQGMTVTQDGQLVVADEDSLKIFRRLPSSLRDLFVQEEVPTNMDHVDPRPQGTFKCSNTSQCVTCRDHIKQSDFFESNNKDTLIKHKTIGHITCTTTNLIYLISCKKCGLQYVGETSTTLKHRFWKHRSTVHQMRDAIGEHFSQEDHSISDMILQGIEALPLGLRDNSNKLRRKKETEWIKCLNTITPHGLNKK